MILYYGRIGKALKEKVFTSMNKTGIQVIIQSDKNNVDYIYNQYLKRSSREKYVISDEIGSMNIVNGTNLATNRNYMILICIFCFINVIIVSEVWIYQRIREIGIRYTFGWSKFRVFIQLYKELFCISIVATLIVLAGQIFLSFAFTNIFLFDLMDILKNLIILLFFALIFSLITLMYPLWMIMKMTPILALQKDKEN